MPAALAEARAARRLGAMRAMRQTPPGRLFDLAAGDDELYRHAMLEAGYIGDTSGARFRAYDPCPVCGHSFGAVAGGDRARPSDTVATVRSLRQRPKRKRRRSVSSPARPVRLADKSAQTLAAPDETRVPAVSDGGGAWPRPQHGPRIREAAQPWL